MAEFATPSAAAIADATTEKKRPEKPDEEAYKAALKKAEKEHADVKAKFVSHLFYLSIPHPIRPPVATHVRVSKNNLIIPRMPPEPS
jgi:hypothetical protein